ncbi:hypothetical protein NIE88_06970 [Sporolactobacillus shoreicorticis]|uniref:DUF1453 domain-containing protein n=1 Tax=Sporolactobacillus shoreicorticis TaxID=1923877 RepID=A0ABW5S7C5_9BACL|nr:hypothetical protein [Sporolactobacillus shoreicorticis]MCO7125511.1 hypothetical protein [Sporolactobacillus shoreicorticis]
MNYSWSIVIIFILFALYRRIRRNIGWQLFKVKRMLIRITLFTIIGLFFLSGSLTHPISIVSDLLGLLAGAALAYYSSKMTELEHRDNRWHYRTNIWIGGVVSALFIGRLLYRFYEVYSSGMPQGNTAATQQINTNSAWSAGLLLIMFAYYVVYYLLLLIKQKQISRAFENAN